MEKNRSGFVAIIGRPNVGKSTLLNRLVGEKLAGVSPKPQTTRGTMQGILTRQEGQIVYLDTPGYHKARDKLGNWMVDQVKKALEGADLIYWMVLPEKVRPVEKQILEMIQDTKIPVFLLINKVDSFPKQEVLPVIDFFSKAFGFKEIIPVSARNGIQTDLLVDKTFEHLTEGENLFPDDQISDQSERYIVSEMIREKIYLQTGQEIPYSTAVVIDEFKEAEQGITEIYATVIVEKDSQKSIVIGKNGQRMKELGIAAREDIERFLGRKIFLKLWVKTREYWKQDPGALRDLGYR